MRPRHLVLDELAIDAARAGWSPTMVRGSAEVLAACAAARIADREIDHAAALVGEAHAVATRTGSVRNIGRVANLRAQLQPYRNSPAVRALDEQLLRGPTVAT